MLKNIDTYRQYNFLKHFYLNQFFSNYKSSNSVEVLVRSTLTIRLVKSALKRLH